MARAQRIGKVVIARAGADAPAAPGSGAGESAAEHAGITGPVGLRAFRDALAPVRRMLW